jgi:sec-independent protein translocase protein TatB|tara:strand:- start:39 stop:278 length:240 start_codon:yes stop_codon:yes gene_type:complete
MPQIGWSELLVIVVIAILVIGPKELPIIMKKVGSWIRSIKSYTSQFQNSLEEISDLNIDDENIQDTKKKVDKKKSKLDT